MKDIDTIATILETNVTNDTIITGGHFLLDGNKPKLLNLGTIESFEIAVRLYFQTKNKYKNTCLGVLLNDIGQTCGTSACQISFSKNNFVKDKYVFPEEYLKILKKYKLSESQVKIFWEKHMRNRGKKIFNKLKNKRQDIIFDGMDYVLNDQGGYGEILLLRGGGNDKYGMCACPIIMGAYSLEQEKAGFKRSLNVYYVGSDNLINIPNHIVIEKGKRVGELFGSKIENYNVYFTEEKLFKNFN